MVIELKELSFQEIMDLLIGGQIKPSTAVVCPRCDGNKKQKHHHSDDCWDDDFDGRDDCYELVCKIEREMCECCGGTGEVPFHRVHLDVAAHVKDAPYTSAQMSADRERRIHDARNFFRSARRGA